MLVIRVDLVDAMVANAPAEGGSNTGVATAKELAAANPVVGDAVPLRQPGQHGLALSRHRPRTACRPARDHPLRRRPGHTGTLMGTGRCLREFKIVAAEPFLNTRRN